MTDTADSVQVTYDGPVVRITLARPDQLNALNDDVRRLLASTFNELEERPDIRVALLEGSGRAFSAGADLTTSAYPDLTGADWSTRRHRTGTWQRLLDQLGRLPQVTVARLHGHVIGGAALLAVACDIRVAADTTVVRIPELAIGIPLTWAGIPLLVREVGLPLARDWVMTCRPVQVDELLRSGFVQRVVTEDDLHAAVSECVAQLLAVPPGPLAMTKAMTSALGRTHSAMAAAWGDADAQQWAFGENEYRAAAIAYMRGKNARSRGEA